MTNPRLDAIAERRASDVVGSSGGIHDMHACELENPDPIPADSIQAQHRQVAAGKLRNATRADITTDGALDETPIVFIVDDDISVRGSLELLVRSAGWVAEASSCGREFLSRPRVQVPNCLILDFNLSDLNGLDVQRVVRAERTETPIIFVSGYGDVPISVEAMKAGAIEFLAKPIDEEALLSAVEQALEESRASLVLNSELQLLRARYQSLSRRERQIMALVVSGLMNKQIAFELGISEITVKAHRGQMNRKMKARSIPELVNMAARLKIDSGSCFSMTNVGASRSE
jgi:FixJ family two-component response regulator